MKNTISFNTKFGWVSATELNNKITSIQFNRVKKKGITSPNLTKLKDNINAYFKGKTNDIKIPIKVYGNTLQKKIWDELKKISKGKTKNGSATDKSFIHNTKSACLSSTLSNKTQYKEINTGICIRIGKHPPSGFIFSLL